MRQKDPRLFYLTMEVTVRKAGVKTVLALDDEARPAILQACHPKGDSRFCLQTKPGGLIRVHTSTLEPTSLYKSLFISEETTSDELLILLLSCFNSTDAVEQYSLYEVSICRPLDCTHTFRLLSAHRHHLRQFVTLFGVLNCRPLAIERIEST